MWNAVRDSRDQNRTKKGNVIPFGRIITNILVQTKMVVKLESDGIIKDLVTVTGSILNANTLRKMNLIQAVEHVPQTIPGIRIRRGPVLAEFETFFSKKLSEVEVNYRKTLKKGNANDAPAGVSRQKHSTSMAEVSEDVPEVVHQKERRTKPENIQQEDAEKKKKKKKSKKEVVEKIAEKDVEKKKKKKKKNVVVEKGSEEEVIQEEVNTEEEEEKEASRKRELALEKLKAVSEKKKRKAMEDVSERPQKKSSSAPVEPPQITKVLTPPSSPVTNTASDHPINTLVLDIQPLQTLYTPHSNVPISQPPPHANYSPIANPVTKNSPESESKSTGSLAQLFRDCNFTPKPRPEPELVVLDAES
ncbi:uncharacterized protein LOC131597363 [Vicia villosa]|uniref:uncharacterized protein LOC131597363 n=1 Tax=Vicia villosa TaxID=3911 RepID=UPI00273B0B6D|nr:uncharacterized protein LOC131597363 [Vicia villosa]